MQGVLAQAKNCDELFCEEEFHPANGKAQSCSQDALVFFLLSLGGGGGGGEMLGGSVFFFKLHLVWRVDCPCPLGQWTFHASFSGRGWGGGFIFLSANGKAQGALLLFLLSLGGGGERVFFPFFPVSQCVLMVFPLSS